MRWLAGATGFPIGDWQFWVATAIALVAAGLLVRKFWPRGKKRKGGTRVQLTSGGKAVGRR